jgi:predicted DNA-binding transcriptional regulator AlpA
MTCACPVFFPFTVDQLRALTLLVIYLVLLAVGLSGAWLWRKIRPGRLPGSSSAM